MHGHAASIIEQDHQNTTLDSNYLKLPGCIHKIVLVITQQQHADVLNTLASISSLLVSTRDKVTDLHWQLVDPFPSLPLSMEQTSDIDPAATCNKAMIMSAMRS